MLLIQRDQTNPYFNIAAEEYVLKHFSEDVFMLWQNEPSVIIGKHQNTMAEVNQQYITLNNIPVVRRISGGGAVFHDLGNINFTFIKTIIGEDLVDFKRFIDPIIAVLQKLGVDARQEGHNDIRINGLKCSGNAEHVFKNRVLHHGTILYSSDLDTLGIALRSHEERFDSRAVKSRRSPVTNIISHLPSKLSVSEFIERVYAYQFSIGNDVRYYQFTDKDIAEIQNLADQKYKTWEWNWGYSPAYHYTHRFGNLICELDIHGGIITQANIYDVVTQDHHTFLESVLKGVKHLQPEIEKVIKSIYIDDNHVSINDYLNLLL
ncbi:MAG: lipoate--protein ligase [Bacteroidota bacterium]|nr:lipoate--protein ligase [Bacteroidota bacterium]